MRQTETPHFYDFGISDLSTSPKTNYFYPWRPQDASNNPRQIPNHCQHILFLENLEFLEIGNVETVRKDGRRTIPTIRLTNSWTYWTWDHYLSNNLEPRSQETKKLRIFETKKPRNQTPRNQDTFLFQVREFPISLHILMLSSWILMMMRHEYLWNMFCWAGLLCCNPINVINCILGYLRNNISLQVNVMIRLIDGIIRLNHYWSIN